MPSTEPTLKDFIPLFPKRCLRCHSENVSIVVNVTLMWWKPSVGETVTFDLVAVCSDKKKCGAVFAHLPCGMLISEEHDFRHGGVKVTVVDTLPYSVSLGGRVSRSLSSLPHSLVQKAQSNPNRSSEAV
jgi:hypothetical protein